MTNLKIFPFLRAIVCLLLVQGQQTILASDPITIVTLGDSITKGVRTGVAESETFSSLIQEKLTAEGRLVTVLNVGIGGERTDGALSRLDGEVIGKKPDVVAIMYGTNDSYVDRGAGDCRLSVEQYTQNLEEIVRRLRRAGIRPILMTEPRWGRDAAPNGVGEHPNLRLEKYLLACKSVAQDLHVPLVDHYAHWRHAEELGTDIGTWTTDQCHPNPQGHGELANQMLPVLRDTLDRVSWKRFQLVFNCDGNAVFADAKGNYEQWTKNLFEPLASSQVDALFWCDGAGGNTANYNSSVLERNGARAGKTDPLLQQWIDAGQDPPIAVVKEGHKRGLTVLYSYRMNDIHDAFIPEEMATFKTQHPEWLLGEQEYNGIKSFGTGLNFAIPEVRELKLRALEEIATQYDFDGLEIDFQRSAPYFPPGTQDENAPLLTELLGRVRDMLDARGLERGRPFRLCVRVDESLAATKANGFDLAAWIDKGLVDMIALGSGVIDIDVEAFRQIAEQTNTPIYPCIYGWPSNYMPIPSPLARGLALSFKHQGADGIYLFNWFPHTDNNSERTSADQIELLREIADPNAILASGQELMFVADRGRPQRAYHFNWMHCVLPTAIEPTTPIDFVIRTPDLAGVNRSAKLAISIDGSTQLDQIQVDFNNQDLGASAWRDGIFEMPVSLKEIKGGANKVRVRLLNRDMNSPSERRITAAEIHVEKGDASSSAGKAASVGGAAIASAEIVISVRRWEGDFATKDIPGGVQVTPTTGSIYLVPTDDSQVKLVSQPGGSADHPMFSPNGEWIYYQSNRGGSTQIYRCRPDGEDTACLSDMGRLGKYSKDAYGYSFCQDSSRFLLTVHDGQIGRLALLNADGSGPLVLFPDFGYVYMGALSPDGKHVVASGPARGYRLLYGDIDGQAPRVLTPDHPDSYAPQFTPEGKSLIFLRRDGDIYRVDVDGTNLKRLTEGNQYVEFRLSAGDLHGSTDGPSLSPDGTKIAYVARRNNIPNVFVMNSDGTGQTQLTFHEHPCGRVQFSPDGNWIAFVSFVGKFPQLYVISRDGKDERQLTDLDGAVYMLKWRPESANTSRKR